MLTWWARICAVATTTMLAVFVPVAAWAADNELVLEAARGRGRRGGGSFLFIGGALCCLLVVGGIVLAVVLVSRNRRRKGPHDHP
ncbi:hypothetical protein Sya03_03880 [Spirilliplanes yamanashiensis]|uniref:Uncharacterized protein n=2 Tax=Spirilliplanes yamanashiensis TaxID=42233 RepID=A0A8J3Y3J7_9ACTN|nr:hypothetical protein [Spirilliplanes yamanashiensis]GIJ01036.1 hypothetical protein Sya03_03880 [Spirilliplanes yamanashiensis]